MAARKTVLITGCSPGGIGHATAVEFHRRGCHVIATARRLAVLEDLAAMGMTTLQLDVTDAASVEACREATARITGGKLDILVNNAGRAEAVAALDLDLDRAKALFDVNVFGTMLMCKTFSRLLIAARGLIINEASIMSAISFPFVSAYSGTKAAVVAYSRILRMELEHLGVRVMVAIIGFVKSSIVEGPERDYRQPPPGSWYHSAFDTMPIYAESFVNKRGMPTQEFATTYVAAALRGPGRLGGWLGGTPDYFWCGYLATAMRILEKLPWWLADSILKSVTNWSATSRRLARELPASKKTN